MWLRQPLSQKKKPKTWSFQKRNYFQWRRRKQWKKKQTSPVISRNSGASRWMAAAWGHPVVVGNTRPTPPFQPAPQASKHGSWTNWSSNEVPVLSTYSTSSLSPVGETDGFAGSKKGDPVLPTWDFGGLSSVESVVWVVKYFSPSTSSSRKQASWSGNRFFFPIDLEQLTSGRRG